MSAIELETARARRALLRGLAPWLFLAPAVVYIILFFGYPIVKNIVMSFQDYSITTFYTGEAPWVGFANYIAVVSGGAFGRTLANTALFTFGSIAFQFAIGLALAVFFQRRFPLNGVLRAVFLLPWLIPLIASSAVWKWILDQDSGILNQVLLGLHVISAPIPWLVSPQTALIAVILVNIWLGIPFNMTILYSGLQGIAPELYEAAALDGATGWKAFWNITLPNLRPVIGVVLILGFVYTLKALDVVLGLTGGGPANASQTLATLSYQESFREFRFGNGAAISTLLIVVSLLFTFIYLRANRRQLDD